MTEQTKLRFLELAMIEQMPYSKIAIEMGISRKSVSALSMEYKNDREVWSKIRKLWKKKCELTSFHDFKHWFETTARKCHYCGLSESEIHLLLTKNKIYTKRLTTRGRSLEIERVLPNEKHDNISNLVYSCYWCNNAKSDEFSIDEFLIIGSALKQVWESRLK